LRHNTVALWALVQLINERAGTVEEEAKRATEETKIEIERLARQQ
jgi:hypothetical protein